MLVGISVTYSKNPPPDAGFLRVKKSTFYLWGRFLPDFAAPVTLKNSVVSVFQNHHST